MIIRISDETPIAPLKDESFLKGRYVVGSRTGLNPGEALFLEALPELALARSILLLEHRTGAVGMAAKDFLPTAEIAFHSLDLSHANNIRRNLYRNAVALETRCEAYLAAKQPLDAVLLLVSRREMPRELAADLLEEAHAALRMGGKCLVAIEGKDPWIEAQFKAVFGSCTLRSRSASASLLIAKKRSELPKRRRFEAEFEMTVHGRQPVKLHTIPGVFSHRRLDEGALALAEVVEAFPGDALLDMGCGCGAVGISIAKNQNLSRACFIDSNARATFITEKNCGMNAIEPYEIVLGDQGLDAEGQFTLFAGNPPYFSHFKIAEMFIRCAHRVLKPGGRAYIVAKNAEWHHAFMEEMFGNAEILRRRGYEVVKSAR